MSTDKSRQAPVLAAFAPVTGAREPVEFAVAASRLTGAPLVIVVVVDTGSLRVHYGADQAPTLPSSIAREVHDLERELADRGVVAEILLFEDSTAARGLARAIQELAPELVVVGTTSRGSVGSTVLGSTAQRMISLSACPVAVVPRGYERPDGGVATIGVAYVATEEGEAALSAALSLARSGGVALRVITVTHPKHAQEAAQALMAELRYEAGSEAKASAETRVVLEREARERVAERTAGAPAQFEFMIDEPAAALAGASEHVDMLVMGSRALGPHRAVVLGSVSRKVIDHARCPVLVIPRGTAATRDALLADVETHAT
jgi:nucleotide-binding universal stress UspA family protein